MSGKVMMAALQQLGERHGVEPDIVMVDQAPPVDHDLVVEGLASTTDIDLQRCRFLPFAFGLTLPTDLPLLFDHDRDQPAGTVDALSYDQYGQLLVTAHVEHPVAKRCTAFSVGARIRQYIIRDADRSSFHAEIIIAELTDISLVRAPINPKAIITARSRPLPITEFHRLTIKRVKLLQRLVQLAFQPEKAT